jgi:hypothetical protein
VIVCIDSGAKAAGVSIFENGELTTAWLARGKTWEETADDVLDKMPVTTDLVQTVVIERMQIYDSTPLAHANDCITLSLMAGRVTGFFLEANIVEYVPHTWKGGVPKNIMTKRIIDKLSQDEIGRVDLPRAKDLHHNIWDAVGLGIYHTRGRYVFGR